MPERPLTRRVGYVLVIGILAKFFIDTSIQLFNPFLVVYAAGIGVSALTMGRLVSVRNLSGLISPVIGSLADRYGYRRIMRFSLFCTGAGIFLFAFGEGTGVLIAAMVIWGIGQGGFAPNIHSYLSAMLPYSRRSRYLGMVEYSWALAGIVGLFMFGMIIENFGWKAPLYILGGGLIFSSMIMGTLPRDGVNRRDGVNGQDGRKVPSLQAVSGGPDGPGSGQGSGSEPGPAGSGIAAKVRSFFDLGAHWLSAWSCILISFFNYFAITHIMIIHGGWLEAEYNLGPREIGGVALLMGIFDWAGSILVSTAGDRIGKKKSVYIGTGGMLVFFLLLPFFDVNVNLAVAGLLFPRFFFEFATVSNFPLISEQVPSQRGKVLSLSVAGGLLGTTIAALTGPSAYLKFGVWGLGPVSAAAVAVSLSLILLFVKEEPHRSQ